VKQIYALIVTGLTLAAAVPAEAQSLRGSRASLDLQVRMATEHDFTYVNSTSHLQRFVEAGYLVRVRGNADY
jgi:hypothetical protein